MKNILLSLLFVFIVFILFSQNTDFVNDEKNQLFIPKYERVNGYVGCIELGVNIFPIIQHSRITPYYPYPSLRMFNGVRLNRLVSVGVEIGLDAGGQFPVDAKVRVHILKRKVTPFFDFGAGYSFVFAEQSKNHGFNFSPSLGLKTAFKKAAFTFRAGYYGLAYKDKHIGLTFDSPQFYNYKPVVRFYSGIHVVAGLEF